MEFPRAQTCCGQPAYNSGYTREARAAGIGMVPAWPADAMQALGNSSLAGCRMLLSDASLAGLCLGAAAARGWAGGAACGASCDPADVYRLFNMTASDAVSVYSGMAGPGDPAMKAAGQSPEVFRYEAGHGFFNERRADVYDANCAQQAWDRMIAFLGRVL